MDIDDFFDFGSKYSSATVQAHAIELDTIPNISGEPSLESDHNRLIVGDYDSLHFPVIFKEEYGKKLDDVLNTGWSSLYLISDKMKLAFEENKLTGWKTFPIRLLDKKGNVILGYHGFSITGRCGPIDYGKSEIIEKRKPVDSPILQKFCKGLYIGLDKWDGSDFFLPDGLFFIIITSKTADILKENKFTNIYLQNLADIETPVNDTKIANRKS